MSSQHETFVLLRLRQFSSFRFRKKSCDVSKRHGKHGSLKILGQPHSVLHPKELCMQGSDSLASLVIADNEGDIGL